MPIYEYRCRGCDREFEQYVARPSAAVTCPHCASEDVMRKLSVFGVRSEGGFLPTPATGGGGCCGGGCSCH